jgi:methyl-accepting chemotaxis protein
MVAPIKSLADTMGRLANSDFSIAVGGTERKDEIGGTSKVVRAFKDNGLRAEALTAQSESMRTEAEATPMATD